MTADHVHEAGGGQVINELSVILELWMVINKPLSVTCRGFGDFSGGFVSELDRSEVGTAY